MQHNNIDEQIKRKLESFEMAPPVEVWEKIETSTAEDDEKIALWPRWLASLTMILVLFLFVFCRSSQSRATAMGMSASRDLNQSKSLTAALNKGKGKMRASESETEVVQSKEFTLQQDDVTFTDSGSLEALTNRETIYDKSAKRSQEKSTEYNALIKSTMKSDNSTDVFPGLNTLEAELLYTEPILEGIQERQLRPKQKNTTILNRFSLELSAGISAFRVRADKNASEELKALINKTNANELGIDVSGGVNFDVSRSIAVYTGLNYQILKNDLNYEVTTTEIHTYFDTIIVDIDTITGDTIYDIQETTDEVDVINEQTIQNTHTILSIPFGIAYRMRIGRRSSLEARLGGKISIYQSSKGSMVLNETGELIESKTTVRNNGAFSGTASLKYLHELTPQHGIYLEPWIDVGINSFTNNPLIGNRKLMNGGVRIGYRFHF